MTIRRILAPFAILALAGCGMQAAGPHPADVHHDAFADRAEEVAEAWADFDVSEHWDEDFVLLDEVVYVPDDDLDPAERSAVSSGWYELGTTLPDEPTADSVAFPDGDEHVAETVDAEAAYDMLAVGGAPPADCPREPQPAETHGDGDDAVVSQQEVCGVLEVTDVQGGTDLRLTDRGLAEVPVWEFTTELAEPIRVLAVEFDYAPTSDEMPSPMLNDHDLPSEIDGAEYLEFVDEHSLTHTIGVGGCDVDARPLVYESEDVVVVAGATRKESETGHCFDSYGFAPVTAEVSAPIGERLIVGVHRGGLLSFDSNDHRHDPARD